VSRKFPVNELGVRFKRKLSNFVGFPGNRQPEHDADGTFEKVVERRNGPDDISWMGDKGDLETDQLLAERSPKTAAHEIPDSSALDDDLGLAQRVEDLAVEQLVAQARISERASAAGRGPSAPRVARSARPACR